MDENKIHRSPVMSHRFRSRHKTYFFDVYENKHGNHYLKLTQRIRDINSTLKIHNIFVKPFIFTRTPSMNFTSTLRKSFGSSNKKIRIIHL